jgi:hypothetical protein
MPRESKKARAEREGNELIRVARRALHEARVKADDVGDLYASGVLTATFGALGGVSISRDEA